MPRRRNRWPVWWSIGAGEWVQMSGSWVNDRTHGQQFKAGFLKATAPTTLEGIEKYLGSGMAAPTRRC
jgi:exodeoxyribonuclease V alpha subunit